jgi:hypothetical protein
MQHHKEPFSSAYAKCLLLIWALGLGGVLQAQNDWPVYGHDPGAMRYSPLSQINTQNVVKLQRVWTYSTTEEIHNAIASAQSGGAGGPVRAPDRGGNGGRGIRVRISEVTTFGDQRSDVPDHALQSCCGTGA